MNNRRGILKKMRVHVGPNMTPMVDIVMCILIFFMLGTSLATPELFLKSNTAAIEKEGLGSAAGAQKLPAVRMNIKLSRAAAADGREITAVTAFSDEPLPMNGIDDPDQRQTQAVYDRLAARRKSISDDVQVLIVPDRNVPYQDVITIYNYCVKLQFKQVAFYPVK
jgi:biopolymer transport protein ExbD